MSLIPFLFCIDPYSWQGVRTVLECGGLTPLSFCVSFGFIVSALEFTIESFRQACKILDFFAAADGRPRSA